MVAFPGIHQALSDLANWQERGCTNYLIQTPESLHIGSTNLCILPSGSPAQSITAMVGSGLVPAANEYCISSFHFISPIKIEVRNTVC